MMFMKRIVLFATIIAVISASKDQSPNSGYADQSEHTINHHHTIYGQPMQDNIAAETAELAKRGAAAAAAAAAAAGAAQSTNGATSDSQGQNAQIEVGTGGAGTNGVISYGAPNSFQQFYSPSFGQYGIFAASTAPSASGGTPQIFYVRPPTQYVTPSGVGTIKLTYTGNQAQPITTIQYAATAPKFQYAYSPNTATTAANQYQVAYSTQPNPYSAYAPYALPSPYTAGAYATTPNSYGATATGPLAAASLQQGQIIPYTAANSLLLNPSSLQQLSFSYPQSLSSAATTVQPLATYTTATPIVPSIPKIGSTVTPTTAAFYSAAPASQTYQQSPAFLSYANAASPLNYATTQKLFAYPSYTSAYRSVVAPTTATVSPSYTTAYIQPTGSSPVKYTLTQPQASYYGSPSTAYTQKLYAPSATVSAASTSPYASAIQQSINQALAAQASTSTGAIQYASSLYPSTYGAATKYGYAQLPTSQKYFYASS